VIVLENIGPEGLERKTSNKGLKNTDKMRLFYITSLTLNANGQSYTSYHPSYEKNMIPTFELPMNVIDLKGQGNTDIKF
jgi:hypothetical protein